MSETAVFDGSRLGIYWCAPFIGLLLSIALMPPLAPRFWPRRQGMVAFFWALAFAAPFAARFGLHAAIQEVAHALLAEYLPFVILIGALFTIAGGIHVGGLFRATPLRNLGLLAAGMGLASFVGTTGASMMLIRPLIRANAWRRYQVHVIVFFIFLVSNIGGALTPLGDPPLFLGYLQGVRFFWPLAHLWRQTLVLTALLLSAFILLDLALYRKEKVRKTEPGSPFAIELSGLVNIPLALLAVAAVAASGVVRPLANSALAGPLRDGALVLLAAASWRLTPKACRESNAFDWAPAVDVAKLFAGIFVTIIPAIAMLRAGTAGAFAPLFALLGAPDAPHDAAYFWLTGALSAFLDNAPTYLVLFSAAGGDAAGLMANHSGALAAISAGAVFMGALTYVGNAPNFLVRAIADSQGVPMPGFFGYMVWAAIFLLPCFAIISLVFFGGG